MFSFQVLVQCVRVCLCVFCVYSVCSVVCQKESHKNERLAAFAYISSLQNGLYLSQKCIAWLEIFTEVSHHFGESVIKFAKQMEKFYPQRP